MKRKFHYVLILVSVLLSGCVTPSNPKVEWEYTFYTRHGMIHDVDPNLSLKGKEGWEVAGIAFSPSTQEMCFVLKRPKRK